jgi:hypothetical protein
LLRLGVFGISLILIYAPYKKNEVEQALEKMQRMVHEGGIKKDDPFFLSGLATRPLLSFSF